MPISLLQRIDVYVNTNQPLMFTINPLAPKSDQHQFFPNYEYIIKGIGYEN